MAGRRTIHDPEKVLDFIKRYKYQNTGRSPTVREIGDNCGISSTSVVRDILIRLKRARLIVDFEGQRNIRLPHERWYLEDIQYMEEET